MKTTFLPSSEIAAHNLDEIFTPKETEADEYRIKRSPLYNVHNELLDVILIHANSHSSVGFYMCLLSRPASSDGPFRFHMGHSLRVELKEMIELKYDVKID